MIEGEGNIGRGSPNATPNVGGPLRIPIAGIGASASVLEALTAVISRLSAGGMGFFLAAYRVGAESLRRPLDDVWNGARARSELCAAPEGAAAGRHEFDALRVERAFDRKDRPPMTFSARCIPTEHVRPALSLVSMKAARRKEAS